MTTAREECGCMKAEWAVILSVEASKFRGESFTGKKYNEGGRIMERAKKTMGLKCVLYCAIGLFLVFLFYFWYTSVYLIPEMDISNDIQEKIWESDEIDFSQWIEGEWDSLVIIRPYTDTKTVREKWNINIDRLENDSIKYADGQTLFLFCKKDEIEKYFYIKYPVEIDDASIPDNERIPKDAAVFSSLQEGETRKLYKISR